MRLPDTFTTTSRVLLHLSLALTVLAVGLVAGCARPGARPEWRQAPADTPDLAEVFAEIRGATAGLSSFRASGRFILRAPELEAVQLLRQSTFEFRAPASIHVIGRKYSRAVFKLTADGDEYVLEMPTEQQYFWSAGGNAGSPAAIAREMFFEAGWEGLDPDSVTVLDYDAQAGRLALSAPVILEGHAFTRRLTVSGPPWRVAESVLENAQHQVVALTRRDAYRSFEGVLLPTSIECEFPLHETFMSFEMTTLVPNTDSAPRLFDVAFALEDLQRRGFTAIDAGNLEEDTP